MCVGLGHSEFIFSHGEQRLLESLHSKFIGHEEKQKNSI